MYKFNVGDRIVANRDLDINGDTYVQSVIPKGSKGTILELSRLPYIRWDVSLAGMHNGDGLCENGHCTAEYEEGLELDRINVDDNPDEDRLEKLISLIATLRDKFHWGADVDLAEIVHSPEFCLEAMIRECDKIRSAK
jgi:hypothetical protein